MLIEKIRQFMIESLFGHQSPGKKEQKTLARFLSH
jgi:hypothetical protein